MDEALDIIHEKYIYDYTNLLPVFILPTEENCKSTFAQFDKAIKKTSNCIDKHTIKNEAGEEIFTAGKWIDDNWIMLGAANYYKREFISAIEAFDYVYRGYKSNEKYEAMYWLAKTLMESGNLTQAEFYISELKSVSKIPKKTQKPFPAILADYQIKTNKYTEAEQNLLKAAKYCNNKRDKARYTFIAAQLYEIHENPIRAKEYYNKVVKYSPNYSFKLNAQIKALRLLNPKVEDPTKVIKKLYKMAKEFKNEEYRDLIYYTIGEIYEKIPNIEKAMELYNLSIKYSVNNMQQKAFAFFKIAEIYFEKLNYNKAEMYYDSTMTALPKTFKNYDVIAKRKTTLAELVRHLRIIIHEDSIQKVAKMNPEQQKKIIDLIKKNEVVADSVKKNAQEKALANVNNNSQNIDANSSFLSNNWYFYNANSINFGVTEFNKKWGGRTLEDNWRRSQKESALNFYPNSNLDKTNNTNPTIKDTIKKNVQTDSDYLNKIPNTPDLIEESNNKIIEAYYNAASIYKDELENYKKAISTFEELNSRFKNHKYYVSTLYQMHICYTKLFNEEKALFYKQKIIKEYPNSEYARILNNQNIKQNDVAKSEIEIFYSQTYYSFVADSFAKAYTQCDVALNKFQKNEYTPKFAYIKAISTGKLKGADSLTNVLKSIITLYPKDSVSEKAKELVKVLSNLKFQQITKDTFKLNLDAPHIIIIFCPIDPAISGAFQNALADYNTKYYNTQSLITSKTLFGSASEVIFNKSFANAAAAKKYLDKLSDDNGFFKPPYTKDLFNMMIISEENLPFLFKTQKVESYLPFYKEHYK